VRFTVFGATGFIGSHLTTELRRRGIECATPSGDELDTLAGRDLGHAVYAIGVTADFRRRPLDTIRAHVSRAVDILQSARFASFVYLSSTRLYGTASEGREESSFEVDPRSPDDLYNLSKLIGEAACLAVGGDRARIVRLANVYGPDWSSDNFLMSLIRTAVDVGAVEIRTAPSSSKDYIAIGDVVALLIDIAERGTHTIYNVASGDPVTNDRLADALSRAAGAEVTFAPNGPAVTFPRIDVSRISREFAFAPRRLLQDLPRLVEDYRAFRNPVPPR